MKKDSAKTKKPSTAPASELFGESILDFIYIDRQKISSIYSQLFGGSLSQLKKFTSNQTSSKNSVQGSIPTILKGTLNNDRSESRGLEETIDPYDMITQDVLNALLEKDFIEIALGNDIPNFNRDLIMTHGAIQFIDNALYENVFNSVSLEEWKNLMLNHPEISAVFPQWGTIDESTKDSMVSTLYRVMKVSKVPDAFLLQNYNGNYWGGPLKPEGMIDSIPNLYSSWGGRGKNNIIVIGSLHASNFEFQHPPLGLFAGGRPYMEMLKGLIYPLNTLMMRPLLIFSLIRSKEYIQESEKNSSENDITPE